MIDYLAINEQLWTREYERRKDRECTRCGIEQVRTTFIKESQTKITNKDFDRKKPVSKDNEENITVIERTYEISKRRAGKEYAYRITTKGKEEIQTGILFIHHENTLEDGEDFVCRNCRNEMLGRDKKDGSESIIIN